MTFLFHRKKAFLLFGTLIFSLSLLISCKPGKKPQKMPHDPHSFSNPNRVMMTHLDLDLEVNFDERIVAGKASLTIEHLAKARRLYLDGKDLKIEKVTLGESEAETPFRVAYRDSVLGEKISINIAPETKLVHVYYASSPDAEALQWLKPEQTAGKKRPFLLSQSQAILARTWIPLQDSPGVRFTYNAKISVPKGLMAVMSAENPTEKSEDGVYEFKMEQPIPAYLLALAAGDIAFQEIGSRTGVYAEPAMLESAANEFADMEKMLEAAEKLYGEYRWGRYDVIVLPPSFPFGGMENPRLTFLTPTVITGDRSLVSLVAHELAHSWSGNLVTNANWNEFWLNEGFTTYFEHRIMEAVYGREYDDMLTTLDYRGLVDEIKSIYPDSVRTHLKLDLKNQNPDNGMTGIAYDKGYLFLRMLEANVGREKWDAFLNGYFSTFAFKSMTSERFLDYLDQNLFAENPAMMDSLLVNDWIYGPGLPENCPKISSSALSQVEQTIKLWQSGTPAESLQTEGWTTHHWRYFLDALKGKLSAEKMLALDKAFQFTDTKNSEILFVWLELVIENKYTPGFLALEDFLKRQGRRKFVRPLFRQLASTPEGKEFARRIYKIARPSYHAITANSVDAVLDWEE